MNMHPVDATKWITGPKLLFHARRTSSEFKVERMNMLSDPIALQFYSIMGTTLQQQFSSWIFVVQNGCHLVTAKN